jgi:hypothetical protein
MGRKKNTSNFMGKKSELVHGESATKPKNKSAATKRLSTAARSSTISKA